MIFLNYPKLQSNSVTWLDRASLPNQAHYKFVALLQSGRQVAAEVIKGEDGLHTVKGVPFAMIQAWRNLNAEDLKAVKSISGQAIPMPS